jgi:hypothetical protein
MRYALLAALAVMACRVAPSPGPDGAAGSRAGTPPGLSDEELVAFVRWQREYAEVYLGKTSKGIGFLDSADAMREAYGPPDAEWTQMSQRLHYYQQGVVFITQHPRQISPAVYAKARAALGKQPSEAPDAAVVTGITVVRPFTVTKAAERLMAGQQVVSGPPETDLLVSPF